ncbi:MAG: CARDB domain-containing protein [candidate division KSB1 bacterium]|nr:CARDB domain-containing protein [candidate division KSB1 bacterium]
MFDPDMPFLSNMRLIIPDHRWLFFLLGLICIVFVFWIYRRTNPPVPKTTKFLLITLKSAALILICLVLFRAAILQSKKQSFPPILAVGIDRSASMSITDQQGNRKQIVESVLRDTVFQNLEPFKLSYFTWASSARHIAADLLDSLEMSRDKTDITQSLQDMIKFHSDEHLAGILLLTDGNYTAGGNPARIAQSLGVPVHTIAIGSSISESDIAITHADIPASAYQNEPSSLTIRLKNTGYGNTSVPVQLKINGDIVKTETVRLSASSEVEHNMTFKAQQTGEAKIELLALPRQNEQISENNQYTGFTTVFKSKVKISLLAGRVSSDLSFIRRYINSAERYDLSLFIEKPNGSFYTPSEFDLTETDLLFLYDFPHSQTRSEHLDRLVRLMQNKPIPVLFISGISLKSPLPQTLAQALPVTQAQVWQEQHPLSIELSAEAHALFKMQPPVDDTFWQQLPPVYSSLQWDAKTDARVPAFGSTGSGAFPFLALKESGRKSAILCAHDLWRWDFLLQGLGDTRKPLRHLLLNLLKWLETPQSDRAVQVHTDKKTYQFGEPVNFDIRVKDQASRPVSDANVRVIFTHSETTDTLNAVPDQNGLYTLTRTVQYPGEHTADVEAFVDDRLLGKSTVRYQVGNYNAELANLQAQPDILKACSRRSGGITVPPDSLQKLLQISKPAMLEKEKMRKYQLWNDRYLLFAAIGLLALEWLIRKRNGML